MNKILFLILIIGPFAAYSQSSDVAILDTSLNSQWTMLSKDWRYQKGDNIEWSKQGYDDTSWPMMTSSNLNMPDSNTILKRGEIGWFRKRLKADNNLNDALVLKIYQTGASEIYLDGKLIHKLGVVSNNPKEVIYQDPSQYLLFFPLQTKEQVLAIRFINDQEKFPVFLNYEGYLRLLATTLKNANSKDAVQNAQIVSRDLIKQRYFITLGVSAFLCILFSSLFLFFSADKINGFFALSSFFLVLFISFVLVSINTEGKSFWINFLWSIFSTIHVLLILYCVYRIYDKKFGFFYWLILVASATTIPMLFLFRADFVTPSIAVLVNLEIIRVIIYFRKKDKYGSYIFLIFGGINILFWVAYISNIFPFVNQYLPYAFMITPISLAIYLGYSFGAQSQSLRLKLFEVEQLSTENQLILFNQNETLEKQVQERTSALNQSLENLKSTQSQLIQSEKMASLGEITAGIAHEIQNPLNFVNNFSEVSIELISELVEEVENGNTAEVKLIAKDVQQNLEKINNHGKRADAIVKGMLQHSRSSSGVKELTDLNALCDEYLRLNYHGLRAKDKSFDADCQTDFDSNLPKVNVIPQNIGRVLLNLINNAFYAVNESAKTTPRSQDYKPTVKVGTIYSPLQGGPDSYREGVKISIKDNGPGIPDAIKEKIFQPFFTTKPPGSGTGLGLSLSYDIIKAHGGELTVQSKEGEGTEFVIQLPI
jgi:signal transduction histidine kinase